MSKVRPRQRNRRSTQQSPIDLAIARLDGTYYKMSEAAKLVGVSQITLRRLLDNESVKAPSEELVMGKVVTYLYTPEDIKELKEHFRKGDS